MLATCKGLKSDNAALSTVINSTLGGSPLGSNLAVLCQSWAECEPTCANQLGPILGLASAELGPFGSKLDPTKAQPGYV